MATLAMRFQRGTIPDLDLTKAYGTYSAEALESSTISISRDFETNVVLTAEFESLTIDAAP